jgi:hypothetical protein
LAPIRGTVDADDMTARPSAKRPLWRSPFSYVHPIAAVVVMLEETAQPFVEVAARVLRQRDDGGGSVATTQCRCRQSSLHFAESVVTTRLPISSFACAMARISRSHWQKVLP